MAPARPEARRQAGDFKTRGEGDSAVSFRKKSVKRRTWRPYHMQTFMGSVREGKGFAFRRKMKIQQSYKKLLWRSKKAQASQESQFTDQYPDHLKHLYVAEEKRLRKQLRKVYQPLSEEQVNQTLPEEQGNSDKALSEEPCSIGKPQPEEAQYIKRVNSVGIPRKNKRKTSNQKAQEEYEQVQAMRSAKRQEFERRRQEREEAQRLYKKRRMEVFKILNKKTRKGQPNFNLQIEYLLKKIQEKN
ncbi:thyroid transcription factor 1-associated protein 26-like [Erinaceus europaeus]|uniref:Thyroid transcription factor 1-associated protein 26-like n=1 Tax=Erinaceus europaeus TaxID=9365 RepID=A0A1S2ZS75_ERIEU|nr:thyroid transcription factor 1-associated protein 26-like [Erinaceus europaeus]